MNRRTYSQVVMLICALISTELSAAPRQPKPNIILIMADDLGWQELGCYGQKKIKTPHLDRIAAEGILFTQFYAGSAVCAPSRCNLLTGRHAGHAYIRNNRETQQKDSKRFGGQMPLPEHVPTIAKTLKQAGYVTGCFGKWGLGAQGSSGDPLRQGFDHFYGYNCQRNAHNLYPMYLEDNQGVHELTGNTRTQTGEQYAPQLIADKVMDFVEHNKDEPFFLYYPTVIPHLPLQVPEEDLMQYHEKWPETPYKAGSYQSHETPKASYAAMISFMDRQIGRLMVHLKTLGLDENTIVFFTSDNGTTYLKDQVDFEFFESVGRLRGLKGRLYEGGIRVPMIVRWPKKIAPQTNSHLIAAHYDLAVTLAELAGTRFEQSDGISFVPTLLGQTDKQEEHPFLFWDFAGYGGQLAVRMGKWKGIKQNIRKHPDAPLELYDLEQDIGESNNIAAGHPDVVKHLESLMISERTKPAIPHFRFGRYSDD